MSFNHIISHSAAAFYVRTDSRPPRDSLQNEKLITLELDMNSVLQKLKNPYCNIEEEDNNLLCYIIVTCYKSLLSFVSLFCKLMSYVFMFVLWILWSEYKDEIEKKLSGCQIQNGSL